MAPRSQEPQTNDKKIKMINYLGTVSFSYLGNLTCSFVYEINAENENKAREIADKLFEKDFPFKESFNYVITIKEITDPQIQKATTDYRKKKMLTEMLLNLEKKNPTTMLKGFNKFWNIQQIRDYFGLKKNIVVVPNTKQVVNIQTVEAEENTKDTIEKSKDIETCTIESSNETEIPKQKVENNKWFCEYNIKIGSQKFRKGTIIEKVDNEIDARKQLDIFIKRNFSRVRSITKVDIKPFENEKEYSDEIVEKLKPALETEVKEKVEKTLDEILRDNFSEDFLNIPSIMVAISSTKPRQKDFENDFLIYKDEGQTDEEIFAMLKKEFVHIKRKNIAIRRVKTKRIFETQQYRKVFLSNAFQQYNEQGIFGADALTKSLGIDLDIMNKKVEDKLEEKSQNIFEKESRDRFLRNFAI